MEWTNIVSAVLAGGIAGQLVTLVWGSRLSERREFKKWLLAERYRVYSQLIDVLVKIPNEKAILDQWTFEIRSLSQKIYLLFQEGSLPGEFSDALESVFELARKKKDGECEGEWQVEMRSAVSRVKKSMSSNLIP